MRKDISEVITKAINEIIARYALQEQKDTARFNENALYVLWLMREQIHKIEANLLKAEAVNVNTNNILQGMQNKITTNKATALSQDDKFAISMVERRAPRWFANPKQKVSIVLLTFLKLSNGNQKAVVLNELIDTIYTNSNDTFDSKENIKTIYSRTKTANGNPNGKVFVENKETGEIMLWDKVEDIILIEYEKYKQRKMK